MINMKIKGKSEFQLYNYRILSITGRFKFLW
jgi:hypothetical protein